MGNEKQIAMLKAGVVEWNAWRQWYQSHSLAVKIDLTGANFANMSLVGARLRNADLRNATLTGANCTDADMRGADMRDCDLAGGKFTDTQLQGANLRKADFSFASLYGTNLAEADLGGAIFTGAQLRGVDLRNADLSYVTVTDAAGLVTVVIIGTCFIDEGTLRRSQGRIAEAFLRTTGATPAILALVAADFRQPQTM